MPTDKAVVHEQQFPEIEKLYNSERDTKSGTGNVGGKKPECLG